MGQADSTLLQFAEAGKNHAILIDAGDFKRSYGSVADLSKIKGIGPARIKDIQLECLACVEGQFLINQSKLPAGSQPCMWFDLTLKDGNILSIQHSKSNLPIRKNQKTNEIMEKIRLKSKGSKYKQ
ncbi:hypothetical protein [Cytobacillus praedii]|uniref:hypothetical protein n=1 Tax=Cytobacillus praedii TaxID=1742358 RepID=UPI002E1D0FF3|nr:hypothetical protein [Cytobacillus praedii]